MSSRALVQEAARLYHGTLAPILPYLFHTWTILHPPRTRHVRRTIASFKHGRTQQPKSSPSPRKHAGPYTLNHEAQADVNPGYNPNITLTPAEEQTFRRLFEAAAKGLPPPSLQKPEQKSEQLKAELEEDYVLGRSLDLIFNRLDLDADVQTQATAIPIGDPPLGGNSTTFTRPMAQPRRKNSRIAVELPEALQGAWRDVQRSLSAELKRSAETRLEGKDRTLKQEFKITNLQNGMEEARKEDESRVQGLLQEAQTDEQVWQVLHTGVFARMKDLIRVVRAQKAQRDLDTGTKPAATKVVKQARNTTKKGGKDPKTTIAETAREQQPTGVMKAMSSVYTKSGALASPQIAVIQSTYSTHLLNGMRTLRTKFPRSPYAPTILRTVKFLDPISLVLGCSTSLYNELLYIMWRQHADISGCARLVEDMYTQGLQADELTSAVFVDAMKDMHACFNGDEKTSLVKRMWWNLDGVQEAMTRWRAGTELLERRAEEGRRAQEAWEMEEEDDEEEASEYLNLQRPRYPEPVAQRA